jgi:N utilization substance protein A
LWAGRAPGERAKIAVMSNERDVDPVGACVGMKGSRVQAIIRELRGEKIDIIEWSDEPSVFAANALSPAKVNKVNITDIENRQMEVIVNEDQLSLAIGKRGQNVRLATKLVGWNIDIRSEEEIKREVTEQMGALIASGEAVPLSAIEGVTAQQADALAEHGIGDIDALAQTTVDDLVEFLDLSLDEAETILQAAQAVIALRPQPGTEETETNAVSAEFDESMEVEVEPNSEMTAQGYDEAVENGVPFSAEPEINAWGSADPVAVTEAEPIPADELPLLESGRDLRPDTITPAPDITSSGVEAFESIEQVAQEVLAEDEEFASEATTEEAETSAPAVSEEAASGGRTDDDENQ